jgi:hypothetical protein
MPLLFLSLPDAFNKMEHLKNLHFTPETPFGLPLYPFFEKAYEAVVGESASKFRYIPEVTPLSTVNEGKIRRVHLEAII